jgi:hypothetical protein
VLGGIPSVSVPTLAIPSPSRTSAFSAPPRYLFPLHIFFRSVNSVPSVVKSLCEFKNVTTPFLRPASCPAPPPCLLRECDISIDTCVWSVDPGGSVDYLFLLVRGEKHTRVHTGEGRYLGGAGGGWDWFIHRYCGTHCTCTHTTVHRETHTHGDFDGVWCGTASLTIIIENNLYFPLFFYFKFDILSSDATGSPCRA